MVFDSMTRWGRLWRLRLVAVVCAGALVGLACESDGDGDVEDPADVKDALADRLTTCFDFKPCPSGLACWVVSAWPQPKRRRTPVRAPSVW